MGEPSEDAVWRVCHVIKGDCKGCPRRDLIGGELYCRGCFRQAEECINTVETGNPWRKTEGVRAPYVVLTPNPGPAQ